ncbi:MAG: 2,3-bisphosphoglycerate-independent phosphoglycerate mutase, partial [Planctomycetes bacterium]|nr:2,3-bisphosphoglycerate-independent phosphoglycerate mutase [Planctomycetota bacterium]
AEEMLVAPGHAAQGGEYAAPALAPGADGKVASTQHSHNPVPCLLVGHRNRLREGGALADVAPTVLQLMGLPQPPEMTGNSLLA